METLVGSFPIDFLSSPETALADIIKARSSKTLARFVDNLEEETVSKIFLAKVEGMPMLVLAVLYHDNRTLRELLCRTSALEIKGTLPLYRSMRKKTYVGVTALWAAARLGNYTALRDLCNAGADMTVVSEKGVSAALASVMSGNLICMEIFLQPEIACSFGRDDKGRNALMVAVKKHDIGLAEALLDSWQCSRLILGNDAFINGGIDAVDHRRNSALHIAARKSGEDMCRLLLQHGCALTLNDCGLSPSIIASMRGLARLASLLIAPDIDSLEHVTTAQHLHWQISRQYRGNPDFSSRSLGPKGRIAAVASNVTPPIAAARRRSLIQRRVDMVSAADRVTGSSFQTARCALDLAKTLAKEGLIDDTVAILHAALITSQQQLCWTSNEKKALLNEGLLILSELWDNRATEAVSGIILGDTISVAVDIATALNYSDRCRTLPRVLKALSSSLSLCDTIGSNERLRISLKQFLNVGEREAENDQFDEEEFLPFHALFTEQDLSKADRATVSRCLLQTLHILVDAGADPNIRDQISGSNALHVALCSPVSTDDVIYFLESAGADIDVENKMGILPVKMEPLVGRRLLTLKSQSAHSLTTELVSGLPEQLQDYVACRNRELS